jgi:hypothetical protein
LDASSLPAATIRAISWRWRVLWLALIGLALAASGSRHVNHDAAWYVYMAEALGRGAALYRDVVDTNPPLIVLLSLPPVWAERLSGLPAVQWIRPWVSLVGVASLLFAIALLERSWQDAPALTRRVLASVLVFGAFPYVKTELGQREHLALLLAAPWMVLAAGRAAGCAPARARAWVAGALAGIGLSLKPHLLAAWLLLECAVVVRDRGWRPSRRPETLALILVVSAYLAGLLLFVPRFVEHAAGVASVYGLLQPPVSHLLRLEELLMWSGAAGALLLVRTAPADRRRLTVLLCIGLGLLAGALVQLRGWPYHLYPARAVWLFFVAAFAWAILDSTPPLVDRVRGGRKSLAALAAAALLVLSARYVLEARRPDPHDLVTPLAELVRREAPGGPIFVMGTLLSPAFPLVNYTGAAWSSRHNSLWFLPGLYVRELEAPSGEFRFRRPDEMPRLERRFFTEIVDDLCRQPPRLLIVERLTHSGPAGRRSIDLLGYYRQSARFDALVSSYALHSQLGTFEIYETRRAPSCQ